MVEAVRHRAMSPAKTAAERKAVERQRHKEAGRTAVTVHVRPEYAPEVRALEAELQRREVSARVQQLGGCRPERET